MATLHTRRRLVLKNKEEEKMTEKTNIIKLRFTKDGEARGREYTYYTPEEVELGDLVAIEAKTDGVSKGIITQINVPEEEIAPFKDRAKTILGKYQEDEEAKKNEEEK